jgi:uncharacterized protein (TIGR02217 family)
MPFWLAERRNGQDSDIIQRFDPRFWTVNFPRPMMASVITTATDALRIDAVFYDDAALAGLIWESEDILDHPLLAYDTDRDYSHSSLSFHWRSHGIMPLNAVNGPTLTVEGRDANGAPRSWFVRLWNYAQGSPEDARITLNFEQLDGGFLLPAEADRVYPHDIDRMFISLVPPQFTGTGTSFASGVEAWVEISDIVCAGERAMLDIGDAMLPDTGLCMATAYDDSFNQTPERLLRAIDHLGYGETINHYVGMSHYFELAPIGDGLFVAVGDNALNQPCRQWHKDFAQRAKAAGHSLIFSLSYELFDAHCFDDWKQRAENGDPALTGWVPPSALLSSAHSGAMEYLQAVGREFAQLLHDNGLPVRFQIGEPWWWVTFDGRICLYDDAARSAFGDLLVSIDTIFQPMDAAQKALLDRAGELLAQSTADLGQAVRSHLGATDVELSILIYLPTIADPNAPDILRANIPVGWARPAFDVLQLEDYDWAVARQTGARARALSLVADRLGYPLHEQHYFAGFVLRPEDRGEWRPIVEAAEEARSRMIPTVFFWALPQVARDGLTYFPDMGASEMQAFDDVRFPLALSQEVLAEARFSTQILTTTGGHERRNSRWSDALMRFDVGPALRSERDLATLMAFYRARRGPARAFRLRDPFDYDSRQFDSGPDNGAADQPLGMGNGERSNFQLVKHYGPVDDPQIRRITHPVADQVAISMDGEDVSGWMLLAGGVVAFDTPPPEGAILRAHFVFDVPVRFAEDSLAINAATFAAGEATSIVLVEVRQGDSDQETGPIAA